MGGFYSDRNEFFTFYLFEIPAYARNSAARTNTGDKDIYIAVRIIPYLNGCRCFVNGRVCWILKLLGLEIL